MGARSRTSAGSRAASRRRKSGPEVDDRGAGSDEVGDELRRRAVGQRQEDRVDRRQGGMDGQLGRREVRVDAAERVVVAVAALEADEVDVRVAREEPDELGADVAGRPDDADADATRPAGR